jgi:glyceraldehyde-3-phosphate dehydrogenase (NADP+)
MKTGDIDILAFIGGSKAADSIIKDHPHPHRLKLFLQLEGKNLGIVTPDADFKTSIPEIILGTTSYNGQRCTAIKLILVHESIVEDFNKALITQLSDLKAGLPWDMGVSITPLPEHNKIANMNSLIDDALNHGARVINQELGGGSSRGNLMIPAVIFPVNRDMRLWDEEQFGPIIPVATYKELSEIYEYYRTTSYGQQASIFTNNLNSVAGLLDFLSTAVGRININTQCGRSPDSIPFSGRRSSALGTMSIINALMEFSIEVVVATKANDNNILLFNNIDIESNFLK